ncbi:MAG: CHASE2 domain-containing protein, partial [Synechococcales cyanobacterium RM1_1_8]|nr:CHASE2 domain-containing protein [Synechococcales cyanobacterium RM1_1_8]
MGKASSTTALSCLLQAGALGGVINFITEPNGRIHRLGSEAIAQMRAEDPLFNSLLTSGDLTLSPSFAAAALEAAQIDYPTPRGSDIFFYGPDQSFRHVPFWKVLDPAGWESLATSGISFKDKIVLIGGTANILQDLHAVPFGSSFRHRAPMAGVEVQANAIATLWQDRSLYDWSRQAPRLRSAMVLLLVLGASWLMSRSQQLTLRLALAAGLALAWVGFSFGLLVWAGQILPLALPLLAIAGFGGAQVITVGIREQLRKQRLRNMLKSHASVPAVREILSQEGEFRELLREREAEVVGKLLSSRYRVIRLLGTGGFSETYIAQDTQRPGSPPLRGQTTPLHPGQGQQAQAHAPPLPHDPIYPPEGRRA